VLNSSTIIREAPGTRSKQVGSAKWNEVLAISGQTESDDSPSRHNKIWYKTDKGFAHSAFLQPVENAPQQPERSVPAEGFWSETSVASIVVRGAANPAAGAAYRVPFGSTFQVLELLEGTDKQPWYRISDGRGDKLFVPAETQRRLTDKEFEPISPQISLERKRVDVDLRKQMVLAYEDDTLVFSARCATGARFTLNDGTLQDFSTTPGNHHIFLKTPSRRMFGGTAGDADHFDLPGIPWVAYFTNTRIAFHGTYWHNDYGRPRSHGCVNLLPEDANWVYRFTLPTAPIAERWTETSNRVERGSLVRVF
jgi:lipoprotein-anchoring transpeptidase ErfK/SrfK